MSSRVRSSWGKEGTWPTWDPAVILTTRWQARCPAWGQEPVCFPPTARSPFNFSPCTDKLHISMICCHGGPEKPSQMLPDQRALGWPHRHTHVGGRAAWVSLLRRGIKSHRTVAAFWSLPPSLLSSKGSRRVPAGCPGWADCPEGARQDLNQIVLHVF